MSFLTTLPFGFRNSIISIELSIFWLTIVEIAALQYTKKNALSNLAELRTFKTLLNFTY